MEGNQFAVILTTIKEDQNDTRRISPVIWYRKNLATYPLLESTTQNHLGAPGAKELITTFPNSASSHVVQGNISLATMLKIWWGGGAKANSKISCKCPEDTQGNLITNLLAFQRKLYGKNNNIRIHLPPILLYLLLSGNFLHRFRSLSYLSSLSLLQISTKLSFS